MSYYIGAKGEYIWEELLDNATSNVIIANNINLDAGPLSDALQDIITDAAGTALGDLIGETTQVPSALGQALITLSSLGLLAYNKLNRTAVQDVDSMVYSADYASILTPGMFDDRVRIRYDSNQFSNAFYYDGTTKKGEILTSRLNLLPVDSTNIDIYTLTGKVGIGITSPATQLHLYATNNILRLQTAPVDGTNSIEFVRGSTTDPLNDYRLHTDTTGKFKLQYSTNALAYGGTGSDLIHVSPTNINIYKDTEITGNVGIGTTPITSFHTYHATNNIMRLGTATNGKVSIEFVRGTDIDGYNDFRLINEAGTFRLQYEDDELGYGNTGTDLISASATQISLGKNTEISGNVGIGTASSSYNLDIFNQSTARIRLQSSSDFGATTSIEFRKGVVPDVSSDYRLINDNATFKLQYENADFPYGNNNNIMTWNRIDVVNYIQTRFSANVGINTDPHATYKLDVNGTVNTTAVRGNGAELTDLNAGNITTGTINLDRITLTANKLYESFNTTNFAVIDNKIDLPPNYSFSITDYDSQTLFNPSAERKYKGKMTANYDDRNGVYKLITTENRTDNVAVLNYRVGDKISIRNTANTVNDYLLESGNKYFNSLLLLKRPTNRPLNWAVNDSYSILMYEWFSSDGLEGRPEARVRTPTNRYFPFTTVMTFIIEAGFNYYLAKLYNQTETAGGSVIVVQSPYGDDTNDFNRAFGAGQTFKLQITGSSAADDYIPKDYISADIGIASDRRLGGVKKGRGVAIDATTGELSSTPVSVDLINSMNTSHFTNNLTTGKIDISSSYVAPNATKLATARNISGVSFDGTANIDIPYSGLTSVPTTWSVSQIPDLGAGKITSGTFSTDRIPDLGAGKITSGTFSTDRIPSLDTGKITTGTFADARIPNLDTGKITTGTFADARIPNLDTGKITTGTFADARIPNLDTGKITTGTFADARIPSLAISKITGLQTALDGKAPTSHTHVISDVSGLQTALDGKASTSHTHIISDVSGLQTALDGKAPTSHTHIISDITSLQSTLDGKQATINSTANQIIIGNGNGLTTTSTGLTFATNTLNATNLSITGTSTLTGSVGIGTSSSIPLHVYNATSSLLRLQTSSTGKPSIEFAVGTLTDTNTDYRMINDNFELKFQYQDNLVSYGATASHILSITDKRTNFLKSVYIDNSTLGIKTFPDPLYSIDVSGDIRVLNGRLGIGVNPATYPLTVSGDINLTGDYRKNGTIFKPDNAVLADNATKLATIRTIAGANFDGTANINIDYFNLNNRPIILQPTTTNLQLVSGYTLSLPGNVGVGTTAIAGNVLQVGSGARLRIANGPTDYSIIGTNDTDGSTNTQIIISGNTRANNAGNIQYLATATGGSHIFYTTATSTRMTISSAGVNVNNDLGVSGNVGIGTAPSATYKVNVNGTLNATNVLLNGNAITGSKWTNGAVATNIYYNSGNVGIGTSTTSDVDDNTAFAIPTAVLYVKSPNVASGTCDVVIRGGAVGGNNGKARLWLASDASHSSYIQSEHGGSGNTVLTFGTANGNALPTVKMTIDQVGNINIPGTMYIGTDRWHSSTEGAARVYYSPNNTTYLRGHSTNPFVFRNGGDSDIGYITSGGNLIMYGEGRFTGNSLIINGGSPTIYFRDSDQRQGMIHVNGNLMYFLSGPGSGTSGSEQNWTPNAGRWPLYINLNNNDATFGGEIEALFYAVSMTNTDYLCVQQNYGSINSVASLKIKAAFGSFTAFHRCYTDDDLYNNETDEDIDLFKNNYMGRVVIATGKIKTDFTRKKETEAEPEPEPEPVINGLPQPTGGKQVEDEWYSGIDKDGIAVEDAVPVVRLSRQRKDKRVFGVFGGAKRSTNNKDRLIVNSVGEGAICVSNTNGNIENGDLLQTSDLLGYAEKQDDDIIRSYTIGKATIDCNFELDSPYYQSHEIENGVRVAFIACTYCCG